MNTPANIDQTHHYAEFLKTITPGKNVVDLACGDGWAGKIALEHGARSVTFADARVEEFKVPANHTNYQNQFIDLNFPQSLKSLLAEAEVVLYFGHLYHCNNHEEILDALVNSDCTDFFIDTKVRFGSPHMDSDVPSIWQQIPELVSDCRNGWHNTDLHVTPGAPNLSWMLDYFDRNKLEVRLQKSIDHVLTWDQQDPFHHRIYIFHVTKSNINN